jgi:hypothetical protein
MILIRTRSRLPEKRVIDYDFDTNGTTRRRGDQKPAPGGVPTGNFLGVTLICPVFHVTDRNRNEVRVTRRQETNRPQVLVWHTSRNDPIFIAHNLSYANFFGNRSPIRKIGQGMQIQRNRT